MRFLLSNKGLTSCALASAAKNPTEGSPARPAHSQIACWILFGEVAVALALFAAMGAYTRFFADEFSTSTRGPLLTAWREEYLNWTGRFSASFAIYALMPRGIGLARVLPAIAMGLWFAALAWAIRELLRDTTAGLRSAVGLAAVVLFSVLTTTMSRGQSFYWETGMLTYTAPLILGTTGFAFALRSYRNAGGVSAHSIASIALIALVVAGFSETTTALEIGVAASSVTFSRRILDRAKRATALRISTAALAGSLIGLTIVIASPGNAFREMILGHNPSVWNGLVLPVPFAVMLIGRSFLTHPLATLLPFCFAALVARPACEDGKRQSNASRAKIAFVALFLIVVCFAPAAYALLGPAPSRALIAPQFVLISAMALLGYLAGSNACGQSWRSDARLMTVTVLVLSIAPIASIAKTIKTANAASEYARAWDRRDAELRYAAARSITSVTVAALPEDSALVRGIESPRADPDCEVNQALASYYQLKEIRITGTPALTSREEWQDEWTSELYARFKRRFHGTR